MISNDRQVGLDPQDHEACVAVALARAQANGEIDTGLDLRLINSLEQAWDIQRSATLATEDEIYGIALTCTSAMTSRQLRCDQPVYGPLFAGTCVASGEHLRVSSAMIGVGAQLAFVFGRSYPQAPDEALSIASLADAIAACHMALQVVARRVSHAIPLNTWTAIADFGLSGAYIAGSPIDDWRDRLTPDGVVALTVDGSVNGHGRLSDVMGHSLHAALWLAGKLRDRGGVIEAGSIVATGSCTGLVQLAPGHRIAGDFGALGNVSVLVD